MNEQTTIYIASTDRPELAAPTDQHACLIVLQGPDTGRKFPLNRDETLIGRSLSAHLRFEQGGVSREHATIRRLEGDRFHIVDHGSTNGTWVNSVKVACSELQDRDLVSIGGHVLKFVAANSAEQAYYQEMYRQACSDQTLQVYNKYYLFTRLEEELGRSQRHNTSLSLVLFDADHFKRINDVHGHLAGDAALLHLVSLAKKQIRKIDVLCRYGGEEFAIILPHTPGQQAAVAAEHLRALIAMEPLIYQDQRIVLTISLGITSVACGGKNGVLNSDSGHSPCLSAEQFIAQADRALYMAKQTGRNRAVTFTPEPI